MISAVFSIEIKVNLGGWKLKAVCNKYTLGISCECIEMKVLKGNSA